MDKKNRYCKGYTAWLAHASSATAWTIIGKDKDGKIIYKNTETGQVISGSIGGNQTKGFGSYFSNAVGTGDTSAVKYKLSGASKPKMKESSGPLMSAGNNASAPSKGYVKSGTSKGSLDVTPWKGAGDNSTKTNWAQSKNPRGLGSSGGSGWSASGLAKTKNGYLLDEYFTVTGEKVGKNGEKYLEVERQTMSRDPEYSNASPYTNKYGTSKFEYVNISKPSEIPSSWDTGSAEFKKWKKNYNAWYYRTHPEKWNLDRSPMSSTSNAYKNEAYKQAAEARAQANANRANRVGTTISNAQRMLNRSARDTSPSRPTFNGELFNAKTRLNDLWSSGASSIANAGKSVINKAKANRSSFNDMWANGASTIAKAGKSFLDAWKSGLKR